MDEQQGLCALLARLLQAHGCTVSCADSPRRLLQLTREKRLDLVILNFSSSGASYHALRQLEKEKETKKIPVIALADTPAMEYELPKVFDFILKPLDLQRLVEDLEIIRKGSGVRRCGHTEEEMLPREFELFREYLLEHSGLHFDSRNGRLLKRGVIDRMDALKIASFHDYFRYLTAYADRRQELQKLLQHLTVGETFFFRYQGHFEALRTRVLPHLAAGGRIRIWSAGCSTGEEPYSLAMTIMETIPDWRKRDIRIIATDINNRALRRAADGIYGERAVRLVGQDLLARYFRREGDSYLVTEEVKSLVSFCHVNLCTDLFPDPERGLADFDAVFCRNVLIYFSLPTTRRVVDKISRSLKTDGYLFLGHAETLLQVSRDFERVPAAGGFFFRKKDREAQILPQPPAALPPRPKKAVPLRPPLPAAPPLHEAALPVQRPDAAALFSAATAHFEAEEFDKAQKVLDLLLELDPKHARGVVTGGFILANAGRLDEAVAACDHALEIDDLLADAYYLKAMIMDITDRLQEAADLYRKAILLDMNFVMPHYSLGKLNIRRGRIKDGERALRNALRLLEKAPEESVIPLSGGYSREVFLEQLRNDLAEVA